jgi:hypothetical protein
MEPDRTSLGAPSRGRWVREFPDDESLWDPGKRRVSLAPQQVGVFRWVE